MYTFENLSGFTFFYIIFFSSVINFQLSTEEFHYIQMQFSFYSIITMLLSYINAT